MPHESGVATVCHEQRHLRTARLGNSMGNSVHIATRGCRHDPSSRIVEVAKRRRACLLKSEVTGVVRHELELRVCDPSSPVVVERLNPRATADLKYAINSRLDAPHLNFMVV